MPRPAIVAAVVATALFMENMDSSVIATSLPAIATDLREDPIILKLAFTAYLLSLAVFIPISGWLADRFGARTIFRAAIVVFTLGSIGCGMSSSLAEFIAARAVQGAGGALMVPVGRLVMVRLVPKEELVRAFALLSLPALVGPVIGPPIGGFITTYFHWRWIFWINVPIGVLGVVLASILIPEIKEDDTPPLDVAGFLLSAFGLSSLIFGSTIIGRNILPDAAVAALMAFGAVLVAAYVVHARRTPYPIIDLKLLAIPTFQTSVVGGFLFRIGIGAIPFLLPLMLQLGFGLTPFQSGSLTFIAAAGALAMKTAAPRILRRFGFRRVLTVNALVSAVFLAACAGFTAETPHLVIMGLLLAGGFFRSLQFTSLNAIAYADVPREQMSRATSFAGVAQQLSLSAGVTIAALVVEATRAVHGEPAITAQDFAWAFVVVALIGASSALFHARLDRNAGAVMAGRPAE